MKQGMDARLLRLAALVPALVLLGASLSPGATFSTANFTVTTGDANFARQCAQTAEKFRAQLAREWLGHELPRWFRPCQVSVTVGQIGAGGATTFTFAAGQVFGWDMRVQGTPERILDSVIPHEVSHTIFASYFRRPLPRWADEGAASLVEHESERRRQSMLLHQVFNTPQRIPLTQLISMKEYPGDMQAVLTLYAEGYSLADYLVQSGGETGKERYLRFLQDAHEHDWNHAIRTWYGLPDVGSLERRWSNWVAAGSPEIGDADTRQIAQADAQEMHKRGIIVRSQSPDNAPAAVRKPQTDSMTADANSQDPGDDRQAPSPVAHRRPPARTAENDLSLKLSREDGSDEVQLAERRREGRERMMKEGWEPLPAASPRIPQVRANGEQTISADGSTSESPARRRFRSAKERQEAEGTAGIAENENPFEETRSASNAPDFDRAESPFHPANR
jgi:hypothetical protein